MDSTTTQYRSLEVIPSEQKSKSNANVSNSTTYVDQAPDDFSEGGLRGWLTVTGSFIMVMAAQGMVLSFGVFQDHYTRVFLSEHTPSEIAWIGSTQLFFQFFLGVPVGKLFDMGHFRLILTFGSILYLFSLFMLSLAKQHNYYQVFLAQGVGLGIAMSCLFIPSISICLHHFRRKKALAVGIASCGGAVGGIVFSIGFNHLLNGTVGFAWGVRAFAFIFLGLFIVANLIMRPPLTPRNERAEENPKPDVRNMFRDVPFLVGTLGLCLAAWGLYFPVFYVQLFAILKGISANLSFYSITILNGGAIAGRIAGGFMADRYGPVNVTACAVLICGGLLFVMLAANTVGGLVAFAILYGFFSGACIALTTACLPAYTENPSEYGIRFGFVLFLQSFILLVANPLAGQLLRPPHYFWSHALILAGVLVLVGGAIIIFSRVLLGKRKPHTWKI